MRYDNQVLFSLGLTALAYQLEAMMDKAPELSDDFENLNTLIQEYVHSVHDDIADARSDGYDEGYSDSEWNNSSKYEEGFEDGRQDGYEDGYSEGHDEGYQQGLLDGESEDN